MTKQLYEEALADVKKLKEVAEDNAKRALLEAVTPRIRDLIENQLLGETASDELLMDDLADDFVDLDAPATPMSPVPQAGDTASLAAMSLPDASGDVTLDLDALRTDGTGDTYELSAESAEKLGLLLKSQPSLIETQIQRIGGRLTDLKSVRLPLRSTSGYAKLLENVRTEIEDLFALLQREGLRSPDKSSYEELLENFYSTLDQLTEQKMTKRYTINEADESDDALQDITLTLRGLPSGDLSGVSAEITPMDDDEEIEISDDEEDVEMGDEGDEGEDDVFSDADSKKESRFRANDNLVVEIDEGMLRREISRMRRLREASESSEVQKWGHGAGSLGDLEDDDLGDPFLDGEVTTESLDEVDEDGEDKKGDKKEPQEEMEEMDQAKDTHEMGADDDEQSDKQSRQPGKTVESIRRRLAAEMKIQAESKANARKAKNRAVYAFHANKFNESVVRSNRLRGMLTEATHRDAVLNGASARSAAETTNLRNKLAETNLFNAKLLFTNKLLQNESLTKRQKAEVIERLDEARTEREVKLVYESLVKALQGSTSRRMTETVERGVTGSSSRPVRPASTTNLNEGYEAERWARLAGIVK